MSPLDSSPLPVCDLLRVSKDRFGRERSPEDQHELNQRTSERENWTIVETYRDVGSASRTARKPRKGFERLIADLKAGTFAGRILMTFENSRGSRQEREWLELIELAEARGVKFWIEVRGRLMDPSDPHDRRDLIHAAADAPYETGLSSVRIRRGTQSAFANGLPHAQIPYGFRRRYNERTGELIEQEHHPDEAPIVAELFERFAAGGSIYSVAQDFKTRGIVKRSGGPFSQSHLRSMLTLAAYAGRRRHDPEWRARSRPGDGVQYSPAAWEPIVNPDVFDQVQRILRDPQRKKWRPGAAKHWLSYIAKCGACGDGLRVKTGRKGELRYACGEPTGCVSIVSADLDVFTEKLLLHWLADPDCYCVLNQAGDAAGAELARVRADLLAAIDRRDELSGRVAREEPGFTLEFVAPIAAANQERIAKLRQQEKNLQPSVLDGVIEPGPDVAKRWAVLPLENRRLVARRLLVPEYIGELQVKKIGRGRRDVPVKDRVRLVRQEK
ncbi:recombinase family protein [Amycolatopsis jiangsuensis]|uniref:DNA invertase Pin-like site-specific DNA recombinase n=1 Tax=Amycolatopsis jiangsuensis TaxID=1181879 RepID=A0A840INJ5_9PSEU|nr:recombinase family protein [Amycolatopsis jiangsuensis]MBB4682947.1 DNA invertase Pin-like site-specific DNA recombinase [Amycolatopsis jiangsuensis]